MKRICKTCTWWCGEESEQSAFCDEKEIFTSAECYCAKWVENKLKTKVAEEKQKQT